MIKMLTAYALLFSILSFFNPSVSYSFKVQSIRIYHQNRIIPSLKPLKLSNINEISSSYIATADYAAEIVEKSIGPEIFTPIFQAGLFLIASGVLAAFISAFLISKSNSWDDLEAEFTEGKEKQLIDYSNEDTNVLDTVSFPSSAIKKERKKPIYDSSSSDSYDSSSSSYDNSSSDSGDSD